MQRKVQKVAVSSKHSDSNPEVSDGSGSSSSSESSDRQIDVITRAKAKGGKTNYTDSQIKGTKSVPASARRSYSSSSSEPSSDDSYDMDAMKFTTYGASNPASIRVEDYISSSESSAKSESDNDLPVPRQPFQVYKVTRNQNDMPPNVSPPVQVMERSGGYDPARIPSSVFERNTTPLEWSVASNESLFSLHIGNVSFNREAYIFGELGIPEELAKSGQLNPFSRTPSVILEEIDIDNIEEIDTARESLDMENQQTNETSVEAFKLEGRHIEDRYEVKDFLQDASSKSSKSIVSSSLSRESGKSFAFPIKKRARPFCYCSNCSWAFCCHTWPIYNCSNCGCAFCYCWNCRDTKCCGHASPILTEAERKCSAKADIPQHLSYEKESEASGDSTSSCCCRWKWFICFSWPSCSCCTWKHCCRWKPSCTWKLSCTWRKCCC